jgi:hypothetical protein
MSSGDLFFSVGYSGRALDSLEAIGHRAAAAGRREEVRLAVQRMDGWLRADPESLGEAVVDYEALEQTEYVGVVSVLLVRYTIHFPSRQVFVNRPVEVVRWAGF